MGLNIIEADIEEDQQDANHADRLALLREIKASTEVAVEVLNDVLLFDKIESTLKIELPMVPIWEVVDRMMAEFKLPASRRGILLRSTYETCSTDGDNSYAMGLRVNDMKSLPDEVRSLLVAGDASRISQVLRNLLSNALKFTPKKGSVQVIASYNSSSMTDERKVRWRGNPTRSEKIHLHNGEEVMAIPRGHFQLAVQDTGVGMSVDQIGKLFGEGVQFNSMELQAGKGSGLGLFIAKGLVEQHKGTLEASSEGFGKGSKFTMKLPLYHVPVHSLKSEDQLELVIPEVAKNTSEAPQQEERRGLRLLVVDDAATNRDFLSRLLERRGHKCDVAENGQVALEMVRESTWSGQEPYDCVLIDYEMPVMNGPTATGLIRELGCDVFIIGVTGNVLADDVQYFRIKGANAILPKPVDMSALDELFVENMF